MKTIYVHVPRRVEILIKVFRSVYNQEIHLAGGAVRDQVYNMMNSDKQNVQVRDWDVFLKSDDFHLDIRELEILARKSGGTFKVLSGEGYEANVVEINYADEKPIQVILYEDHTIEDEVSAFTCNASQVYVASDGLVKSTDSFMEWIATGKLVFHEDATQKYRNKISRKFNE